MTEASTRAVVRLFKQGALRTGFDVRRTYTTSREPDANGLPANFCDFATRRRIWRLLAGVGCVRPPRRLVLSDRKSIAGERQKRDGGVVLAPPGQSCKGQ
jgi:hypothetical protein